MRRLIRAGLFAVARLGLILAVVTCVAGQWCHWIAWASPAYSETYSLSGDHTSVHFGYTTVRIASEWGFNVKDGRPEVVETEADEFMTDEVNTQTPVCPGVAYWQVRSPRGFLIVSHIIISHAYIILASIWFYAAVKLLYWKRPSTKKLAGGGT